MKKQYFSFLILLFLSSCSPEKDCGCKNIEMNFDIAVKNKEGDNLINNINFENIEVKYLINNQIVSGQKPLLIEDDEDTRIRVFLNNYPPNGFPITYVKWNEIDTDTIKAKFFYNQDVVNQIWFNDSLVTPIINSKNFYTIVKN